MNTCSAVKYRQMEMATYRITSEKNGNGTYSLYIRGSKEVNEYISEAGVPKFQRHFT
jgi:hypothetical protein